MPVFLVKRLLVYVLLLAFALPAYAQLGPTCNLATCSGTLPASKGGLPSQTGNNGKFLTTNGTTPSWATVSSGSGTVTDVSVVTANGVSGSVATSTTTPAITLTLGAITPSSVVATGVVNANTINISGSKSSAAWTTAGIGLTSTAASYTDTTSSGTVATMGVHVLAQPTILASNATTFTRAATLYIPSGPLASTNVTQTNTYAINTDAAVRFGGNVTGTGNIDANSALSAGTSITGARLVVTGSTIPANGVYLPATNSVGFSTNSTAAGAIDATGHLRPGRTTAATIGTCGVSPTITGNDHSGVFTTGSGALTACTISFGATYTTAPRACVISPADAAGAAVGTTGAYVSSISTTAFVVTGANLTSISLYYICF